MAGFNTAVTGLKAAQTDLDVTGNNIANSSTVGFKSSRTEFGDIYATAVVGAGSANVAGSGVTVADIAQDFSGGTIEFTNNNLDLAINGSGFFQLDDGQGGTSYTRAGAFELNKDGQIVSKSGAFLQGYGLDSEGNRLPINNLEVTQKESPPKATEEIDLSFNIDSREDPTTLLAPYNKDEAGSLTYTTTVRTFDSLGNENTIKFDFVEQRPVNERRVFQMGTPGTAPIVMTLSGSTAVTLDGTDFTVPGDLDAFASGGTLRALNSTDLQAIQRDDPRINNVFYDSATNQVTVEFKSSSTEYGDVVITAVDSAGAPAAVSADLQGDGPGTNTTASNEVHYLKFDIANAASFNGDNILDNNVSFQVGGVSFDFNAGDSKQQIIDQIVLNQGQMIDANPDIELVSYDTTLDSIVVTYKSDAGSDPRTDALQIGDANGVFLDGAGGAGEPSFVREGDNSHLGVYRQYAYLNGTELLQISKPSDPGESAAISDTGPILIKFNPTNGLLSEVNGSTVVPGGNVPGITIYGADPADPQTTIDLDLTNTTQFASASIVKQSTQDGYTKGDLIGVTFESTGEMVASFSNGQTSALGVVAIATFENNNGLQPAGDTTWVATLTSGQAIVNPPGTGLNGTLRSAALEQSNVDLSEELVKLIEAQRNFQANSKTLETLNQVTQSILQI